MTMPGNFDWGAAAAAYRGMLPTRPTDPTDDEVHNYVDLIYGPNAPPGERQTFSQLMQQQRAKGPRQFSAYAPQQGYQPMNFNPIAGAADYSQSQANHMQGMAGDVMGAIANENQSRVAQMREQDRMQHEKDLEQMRMNTLIQQLGQYTPKFWK